MYVNVLCTLQSTVHRVGHGGGIPFPVTAAEKESITLTFISEATQYSQRTTLTED